MLRTFVSNPILYRSTARRIAHCLLILPFNTAPPACVVLIPQLCFDMHLMKVLMGSILMNFDVAPLKVKPRMIEVMEIRMAEVETQKECEKPKDRRAYIESNA